MAKLGSSVRTHAAGLRILLVLTVVTGIAYPAAVTALAQIPGLHNHAEGSMVKAANGTTVGSSLIGQEFTDSKGNALPQYFQSRPSDAGMGYDPTASGASNLGPESIVDTLADPKDPTSGKPALLSQVCTRSLAVGTLEHVDGSRPFCTPGGLGAVLAVFWSGPGYAGHITRVVSTNEECAAKPSDPPVVPFLSSYKGVKVKCAKFGDDLSTAQTVPIKGNAPDHPAVPADAVTASGSGLDPDISPAYAALQVPRVATARHLPVGEVRTLVSKATDGRGLGFLGEPTVDVLTLNLSLDRTSQVPHS